MLSSHCLIHFLWSFARSSPAALRSIQPVVSRQGGGVCTSRRLAPCIYHVCLDRRLGQMLLKERKYVRVEALGALRPCDGRGHILRRLHKENVDIRNNAGSRSFSKVLQTTRRDNPTCTQVVGLVGSPPTFSNSSLQHFGILAFEHCGILTFLR